MLGRLGRDLAKGLLQRGRRKYHCLPNNRGRNQKALSHRREAEMFEVVWVGGDESETRNEMTRLCEVVN